MKAAHKLSPFDFIDTQQISVGFKLPIGFPSNRLSFHQPTRTQYLTLMDVRQTSSIDTQGANRKRTVAPNDQSNVSAATLSVPCKATQSQPIMAAKILKLMPTESITNKANCAAGPSTQIVPQSASSYSAACQLGIGERNNEQKSSEAIGKRDVFGRYSSSQKSALMEDRQVDNSADHANEYTEPPQYEQDVTEFDLDEILNIGDGSNRFQAIMRDDELSSDSVSTVSDFFSLCS